MMDPFQKHAFMKNHQRFLDKKTSKDESSSRPHLLYGVANSSRPPSLLERSLLPGLNRDHMVLPTAESSSEQYSKGAQLTIFYAGAINVYDNVPVDKAQAIMLLASSVSPPIAKNVKRTDVAKPVPSSQPSSLNNAKEELPIARRHSLRRFLEKRRGRVANSFPYANSYNT